MRSIQFFFWGGGEMANWNLRGLKGNHAISKGVGNFSGGGELLFLSFEVRMPWPLPYIDHIQLGGSFTKMYLQFELVFNYKLFSSQTINVLYNLISNETSQMMLTSQLSAQHTSNLPMCSITRNPPANFSVFPYFFSNFCYPNQTLSK